MKLRSAGVDDTRAIGAAIADALSPGDVVVLAGDLGSGKTACAQGIAQGLEVDEPVASPSFVIVREYEGRLSLAHVDVYRLERFQELHDLGFDEIVDSSRVTVIEWGDRVSGLLPPGRLEVHLREGSFIEEREIELVPRGPEWEARAALLAESLEPWRRD